MTDYIHFNTYKITEKHIFQDSVVSVLPAHVQKTFLNNTFAISRRNSFFLILKRFHLLTDFSFNIVGSSNQNSYRLLSFPPLIYPLLFKVIFSKNFYIKKHPKQLSCSLVTKTIPTKFINHIPFQPICIFQDNFCHFFYFRKPFI